MAITNHTSKTILMVFPRVPYPLSAHGVSVRYLPVIKHLSRCHALDIIIICDLSADSSNAERLKPYCRKLSLIQDPRYIGAGLAHKVVTQAYVMLPWSPPNHWVVSGQERIKREIAQATAGIHYDSVVCVGGGLFLYSGDVRADRMVVDFIDSPSLSVDRQVVRSFKSGLIKKYESWKAKRWEARIIRDASASLYVSAVDAQTIPSEWTPAAVRQVVPNGISVDTYTPAVEANVKSPSIGFLGNMGYGPNIEAAHRLYEEVFLPLRAQYPDLSFYLIGRNPVESILALGEHEGVTVTGAVQDIWPYVNAVDLFVLPLLRGAGLKNKVLEVMYAKRPVVSTKIGNEGIDAVPGRDLIICDTGVDFQREVLRLLGSPDERVRLGEFGHRFVSERFSWDRILWEFEAIITGSPQGPIASASTGPGSQHQSNARRQPASKGLLKEA